MVANANEFETIEITAEPALAGEIARAEAEGKRIILVRDGMRYRVEPVTPPEAPVLPAQPRPDPWEGYDPEKVRESITKAAGSITVEEAERIKKYIYAAREAGTRPPDRP